MRGHRRPGPTRNKTPGEVPARNSSLDSHPYRRPGRHLDRPHERRPAPGSPAAQQRPQDRSRGRGRPGMILGRVWTWKPSDRGVCCHILASTITGTPGGFASSAPYSRCSRWVPPVGFEPTHTAPESASVHRRSMASTRPDANRASVTAVSVPGIFRIMVPCSASPAPDSALPPRGMCGLRRSGYLPAPVAEWATTSMLPPSAAT